MKNTYICRRKFRSGGVNDNAIGPDFALPNPF
jgi:hypothetical protein